MGVGRSVCVAPEIHPLVPARLRVIAVDGLRGGSIPDVEHWPVRYVDHVESLPPACFAAAGGTERSQRLSVVKVVCGQCVVGRPFVASSHTPDDTSVSRCSPPICTAAQFDRSSPVVQFSWCPLCRDAPCTRRPIKQSMYCVATSCCSDI